MTTSFDHGLTCKYVVSEIMRSLFVQSYQSSKKLIEGNVAIYILFRQTFGQIPLKYPHSADPSGTSQVRDYKKHAINVQWDLDACPWVHWVWSCGISYQYSSTLAHRNTQWYDCFLSREESVHSCVRCWMHDRGSSLVQNRHTCTTTAHLAGLEIQLLRQWKHPAVASRTGLFEGTSVCKSSRRTLRVQGLGRLPYASVPCRLTTRSCPI